MHKLSLALALSTLLMTGCGSETVVDPPPAVRNGNLYFSQAHNGRVGTVESVGEAGTGRRTVVSSNSIVSSVAPSGRMLVLSFDTVTRRRSMVVTDLNGVAIDTVPTVDDPQLAILSPDGKKICYGYWDLDNSTDQSYTLHLVNSDGTGDVTIPVIGAWEGVAAFSPDSRMLAFYSDESLATENKLYVVNSDGTGLRMLTDQATSLNDNYGGLCWSPSGGSILYMRRREGGVGDQNDIWRIGTDGTGAANLTSDLDNALMPNFSPDGARIVFSAGILATQSVDLWTMKSDGSDKRSLTNTPGLGEVEVRAQWSPDGRKIACISLDMSANDDVFFGRAKVVDATTGASTFLTTSSDIFNIYWSTAQ